MTDSGSLHERGRSHPEASLGAERWNDIVSAVQGAIMEYGPDGHIDGAEEIAIVCLETADLIDCRVVEAARLETAAEDHFIETLCGAQEITDGRKRRRDAVHAFNVARATK